MVRKMDAAALCSAGSKLVLHTISSSRSVTAARSTVSDSKSWTYNTTSVAAKKKKKKHFLTQNISIQNRISVSGFVWWSVHHFLRPKPELQIIMDNIHSAKATDMATISFQSLLYTSNVKLPSLVILSYTTHNLKVVTTLVQSWFHLNFITLCAEYQPEPLQYACALKERQN